jgi:hypothetical protein
MTQNARIPVFSRPQRSLGVLCGSRLLFTAEFAENGRKERGETADGVR